MREIFLIVVSVLLLVSVEMNLVQNTTTIDTTTPVEILIDEENVEFQEESDQEKELFFHEHFSLNFLHLNHQQFSTVEMMHSLLTCKSLYKPPRNLYPFS